VTADAGDVRGKRSQNAAHTAPGPGRLTVRTVPVADPGNLLARLPRSSALAWVRQGSGLVGWGAAARITLPAGEDRFTAGEKWLRDLFDGTDSDDQVQLPGSGPVAFGSFTFDPASDGSVLIVPRTILGRDSAGRAWLTTVADGSGPPGPSDDPVPRANDPVPPANLRWHDGSLTAPQWEHAVAVAVDRISSGGLRKVVLARDVFGTAADPIDPRMLLLRLADRYPDCFTFACANLVGATPELLVRRRDSEVSALILAGTAPRGGHPAEDAELGAALLASAKNTEEHAYAVTSVREVLAPLCSELGVSERPSLLKLANVYHLGTPVRGTLAADRSALSLAGALHPTAAVCGTPAEAALELIRELESMERGRYAGPVGWVDACGNGEFGIALRCANLDGRKARLFAGCGIVAGSDPTAELAETEVKLRPMRHALEG
jgi:menaquinone-specific isochorismate synthase